MAIAPVPREEPRLFGRFKKIAPVAAQISATLSMATVGQFLTVGRRLPLAKRDIRFALLTGGLAVALGGVSSFTRAFGEDAGSLAFGTVSGILGGLLTTPMTRLFRARNLLLVSALSHIGMTLGNALVMLPMNSEGAVESLKSGLGAAGLVRGTVTMGLFHSSHSIVSRLFGRNLLLGLRWFLATSPALALSQLILPHENKNGFFKNLLDETHRMAAFDIGQRLAPFGMAAGIAYFKPGDRLRSNDLLYVDSRKVGPHFQEKTIQALVDKGLPPEIMGDRRLKGIMKTGLRTGLFRDTYKIERWVDAINADLRRRGLPEIHLVVAHAESVIDDVARSIEEGHRPAGIQLSGSPKMLSEAIGKDPVVDRTIGITQQCLDTGVPMFGFCFGMHLMAFARYGAVVEYLQPPEGTTARVVGEGEILPVLPCERFLVFGVEMVRNQRPGNILMGKTDELLFLEVHTQHLPFPHPKIPSEAVLGTGELQFQVGDRKAPVQSIEVAQFGPKAFGAEGHPELTPQTLEIFLHIFMTDALTRQGEDIARRRREIEAYPRRRAEGELVGYRWMRHVLLPDYLQKLLSKAGMGQKKRRSAKDLLARIEREAERITTIRT